jgi:hypothetical protein
MPASKEQYLEKPEIEAADSFEEIKRRLTEEGFKPRSSSSSLRDSVPGMTDSEYFENVQFYNQARKDWWVEVKDRTSYGNTSGLPGEVVDLGDNSVYVAGYPHETVYDSPSDEILDALERTVEEPAEVVSEELMMTETEERIIGEDSYEELDDFEWAFNQSNRGIPRFFSKMFRTALIPGVRIRIKDNIYHFGGNKYKSIGEVGGAFTDIRPDLNTISGCEEELDALRAINLPLKPQKDFKSKYDGFNSIITEGRSEYQAEEAFRTSKEEGDDVVLLTGLDHVPHAVEHLQEISNGSPQNTESLPQHSKKFAIAQNLLLQ